MTTHRRHIVTLEHRGHGDDIATLRQALKVLWRRFDLKCLAVREETPAPAPPPPTVHPLESRS